TTTLSQELYKYLEQRKEGDEIAGLVTELLIWKWVDLIEFLNTEEGKVKLEKLLRNLKKWGEEGRSIEEAQQQQQQQQQQPIEPSKGEATSEEEGSKEDVA
ncbi:unnamed protein product, partial [marine sediment metagenome]